MPLPEVVPASVEEQRGSTVAEAEGEADVRLDTPLPVGERVLVQANVDHAVEVRRASVHPRPETAAVPQRDVEREASHQRDDVQVTELLPGNVPVRGCEHALLHGVEAVEPGRELEIERVGELERDVEVCATAAEPVDEVLGVAGGRGELVGQPDVALREGRGRAEEGEEEERSGEGAHDVAHR